MNFIIHVICNLLQVVLGVAGAIWVVTLLALFGQGIIDVSNHAFQCGVMFLVAMLLSPFFFKTLGRMWDRLAGYKRQMV